MQCIFIPIEISDKLNHKIFKRKYTGENLKKNQIPLDKIDWRRTLANGNKDTNNSFQIFL